MNLDLLVQDKGFLRDIIDSEFSFQLENGTIAEFVFALMSNLYSSDPELRDTLSYTILEHVIENGHLSESEMEELLSMSISEDYLFFQIGDMNTDSVFVRSFSVLIVGAILQTDAKKTSLTPERVLKATQRVMEYAKWERDRRGFIEEKGWAHSVAHTADALNACAQHPVTTMKTRLQILEIIADLSTVSEPLIDREDDRLAYVVYRMIEQDQIPTDDFASWLHRFAIKATGHRDGMRRQWNANQFLQCLYFLVHWKLPGHTFLDLVSKQLKHQNVFYQYGLL